MARADKPLPPLSYLEPRVRISRWLATLSYAVLVGWLAIYNLFISDLHGANPLVILGVQLIPLLVFLPGLVLGNVRAFAWLCFAINLYFIYGVLTCFHPGREVYGGIMVAASATYFVTALGYVRWSFQAQRVRLTTSPSPA